ncbi:SDR family NAD(P)-dependent oxidoreductase [Tropicibacter naphthalenivorans]|uniref:Gluconate 5-dehydrogenase n=1 Tax=Tropicibacter naphthalenivorans TaxID=441103 RepID=A0A0P1G1Y1_9RHOB|nr:SDR family oxidoreductase [Tropicibacter naphthalenivorans]CUH75674.1 Gluconate 5-dehydrogenase [Tropicibacter naphthalenivorans]SMC42881.1 NAD(P)-dependent dehydrogenase, short-chain alcohol dehydrogenase family [Tropicibacter naphthalenivorans]
MSDFQYGDLDGASVFITGGGAGIGAALTEGFLAQGAKVGFVQRSDASEFCAEMAAKYGRAPHFVPCDITDTRALRAAIDEVAEVNGPVSVLVNNAANDTRHATLDMDEADWDAAMAVNLKAYFFATQAVVPMMQAIGGGAIINFSSISYMLGIGDLPAYTSANGAITAMTRGHAREFGCDGIRVNALAPGWVLTERQMRLWATPEDLSAFMEKQCLKRHLTPKDIVGPVLFLASNASAMMTGQCIAVDGGVVTVAA